MAATPRGPATGAFRLLHAFARLECAWTDYFCPSEDESNVRVSALQQVSLLAAQQFLQPGLEEISAALNAQTVLLRTFFSRTHPTLRLSVWEGFRYYALFPDRYVGAADGWRRDHSGRPAWVIGLRSMGSALAPVVAARLMQGGVTIRFCTLRPRGEPQQRHCRIGPGLRKALQEWPGDFLIVDEGPGLSGSSFGSAALLLESLGMASSRIALLPAWDAPAGRLNHAPSAAAWQRLQRYAASPLIAPDGAIADLGAGNWRKVFPHQQHAVAWPQHERAKYFSAGHELIKFAGLGDAADSALQRARQLATAGFAPAVTGAGAGWLRYRVMPAEPLRLHSPMIGATIGSWSETAGNYLAFVASRFRLGERRTPHGQLLEMVRVNLRELLHREDLPDAPEGIPVALDARMLPQEWGWVGGHWIKFDGIDHCDDPFFPGPCDIAWDLASVEIEYGRGVGDAVLNIYRRRSGDSGIGQRLPWYRLAYCAFRSAYSRLAATQTGEPDASRWAAQAKRYERILRTQKLASAA